MVKKLTERDLRFLEEAAHNKFWDEGWTIEEVMEPDASRAGCCGDFRGSDGFERSVQIIVRVIPHPK